MAVSHKDLLIIDSDDIWQPNGKKYEENEIFKMLYDIGASTKLTKFEKLEDPDDIVEKNWGVE